VTAVNINSRVALLPPAVGFSDSHFHHLSFSQFVDICSTLGTLGTWYVALSGAGLSLGRLFVVTGTGLDRTQIKHTLFTPFL